MSSKEIRSIVKDVVEDVLQRGAGTTISDISEEVIELHPQIFLEYGDSLARNGLNRMIHRLLRNASEGESDNPSDQLALPGFTIPAAISYKDGEDIRWIASRKAKWEHIVKTDDLKAANIESARKNRKRWLEIMDYLRPAMESSPDMTLEEAVRVLSEAAS